MKSSKILNGLLKMTIPVVIQVKINLKLYIKLYITVIYFPSRKVDDSNVKYTQLVVNGLKHTE